MNPKTHWITRRTALRGFGAAVTLPYLEIMGGRTRAAQGGGTEPRRLACFYIPGAIGRSTWFPAETGPKYQMAAAMKPLEKHRDQVTVLTNLLHITGRISGHVHPYNWLTGHNININPGTITNTVSMDQVAAKHLGATWVPSLALSFADGVGTATLSRNALGVDVPATANYRSVFERLFPPADKDQLKEAKGRLALNKSVLDTAGETVKDFQRQLGADDKKRLDQYLESIREVERRLGDSDLILDRGRPKFDEEAVKLVPQGKNGMREHIELMMDLVALAFQPLTHVLDFRERAQRAVFHLLHFGAQRRDFAGGVFVHALRHVFGQGHVVVFRGHDTP
mgnify:CR=1 FL=1